MLSLLHRAALALAAGLLMAAAASAQPTPSDRLSQTFSDLDLSTQQRADLDAIGGRYDAPDRAALWQIAADVEDVLTADQVRQLREHQQARRDEAREAFGDRDGRRAMRGRRGARGARAARAGRGMRAGRGSRAGRDGATRDLTEAQRDALRAVRSEHREAMTALTERFREGDLSDEAYLSQREALRERAQQARLAALPAEARARHAEAQARRDAVHTAREQALGLTDAQEDAIQSLRLDRVREAPGRPDLRPYLDADGRLDRSALREAQRAQRTDRRAERDAQREQMADILTDEQQAVVAIHRALARSLAPQRELRRGRRGR